MGRKLNRKVLVEIGYRMRPRYFITEFDNGKCITVTASSEKKYERGEELSYNDYNIHNSYKEIPSDKEIKMLTKEEVIKGNKNIAEYLCLEKDLIEELYLLEDRVVCTRPELSPWQILEDDWTSWARPEEMLYHQSWDWLAPIINKIYQDDLYGDYVSLNSSVIEDFGLNINFACITATWRSVVEFIEWRLKC